LAEKQIHFAEKQIARSGKLGTRPSKSCSNECFKAFSDGKSAKE
jgi:hypothetical protein